MPHCRGREAHTIFEANKQAVENASLRRKVRSLEHQIERIVDKETQRVRGSRMTTSDLNNIKAMNKALTSINIIKSQLTSHAKLSPVHEQKNK